jgi:hypothetical protein
MIKFFQKLKEQWEVDRACRQTIEIYKTGTAEERQQIEEFALGSREREERHGSS